MNSNMRRISVSVGTDVLELEGDESFLDQYKAAIDGMIERLGKPQARSVPGGAEVVRRDQHLDTANARKEVVQGDDPDSFGEALQQLPRGVSQSDQMLLAAQWAQNESESQTFTSSSAATLLIEQGVKVGNPSQCVTNNVNAKRAFKFKGRDFKVSKSGAEYLAELKATAKG